MIQALRKKIAAVTVVSILLVAAAGLLYGVRLPAGDRKADEAGECAQEEGEAHLEGDEDDEDVVRGGRRE